MLEYLPEAEAEMTEAAAFYEAQRRGLGAQFLDRVESAWRLIEDAPFAGSPWLSPTSEFGVRRVFVRGFPFAIVYATAPKLVVVAIAHTKRRPDYWITRLRRIGR